jgi:hypothetical protein
MLSQEQIFYYNALIIRQLCVVFMYTDSVSLRRHKGVDTKELIDL